MKNIQSLQSKRTESTASYSKSGTSPCSEERTTGLSTEAAAVRLQDYKFIQDRLAIPRKTNAGPSIHAVSYANSLTRGWTHHQLGAIRLGPLSELEEEDPFVFIDDSSLQPSSLLRANQLSDTDNRYFPHNKADSFKPFQPADAEDAPLPESFFEENPKLVLNSPDRSAPRFLLDSLAGESSGDSIESYQEKNRSSKAKGIDTVIDFTRVALEIPGLIEFHLKRSKAGASNLRSSGPVNPNRG